MLHDLACIVLGIGVYFMFVEFKKYRAKKEKTKVTPAEEFGYNQNTVEARMLFNKDQVFEILAAHTAMRRGMPPGNYSYHGLFTVNQRDGILNVRIEIKKTDHDS